MSAGQRVRPERPRGRRAAVHEEPEAAYVPVLSPEERAELRRAWLAGLEGPEELGPLPRVLAEELGPFLSVIRSRPN